MSNQYKDIPSLIENEYEKTWSHPRSSWTNVMKHPELQEYTLEKVPIADLIKANDLNNKVNMSNHYSIWSPTGEEEDLDPEKFVYDREKDNDPNDFIRGIKELDGTIKLGNGRHRVKALGNGGYTHVVIPVHDKFFDENPIYASAYKDARNGKLNQTIRKINVAAKSGLIPQEDAVKLKEKLYKMYIRRFK